ncbi:hypothetical protein ACO7_490113 [Thiomonas arsenitoxydans]|nr:hypothetical protein ACO7_490113 [Thiomonas arsenitoxydans]CQR36632.1 hypothetical protein ACO3_490113 [Thiomonas arsenitoxydans]CQR37257.1 hypothetical protein THICB6_40058 [Thiomonas arsenitoxydans]
MFYAGIAQLVERNLAKVEVASSSLVSRSKFSAKKGSQASLFCVRCMLSLSCDDTGFDQWQIKPGSALQHPAVLRTISNLYAAKSPGGVAEWLCSGLQSRLCRFDSDPRLQISVKTTAYRIGPH